MTDITYHLYAITINPRTHIVERSMVLKIGYGFNEALKAVEMLETRRDSSAKLGTLRNPLRFEAVSPVGIAERF